METEDAPTSESAGSENTVIKEPTAPHPAFEILSDIEEQFSQYNFDVLIQFDQDYRHLFANSTSHQLWSIPREGLVGKSLRELDLPEEQVAFWENNLRNAFDTGEVVRTRFKQPGERRSHYWSCEFHPYENSAGEYESVICFARDITESVRLINELSDREQKYRLLIENQTDMVTMSDVEHRLLYINPSCCTTFGISEKDMLGKSFIPMLHEDDQESTREGTALLYEPPHFRYLENRAKTIDGWKWFSWTSSAIINEDGNIDAIVSIGQDIDKRKRYQDLLAARLKLNDLAAYFETDEFLTHAIDLAEQLTESQIGFLHFYDEPSQEILLHTWSTNTVTGFCAIDAKGTHYPLEKAGVWGDAIRERKAIIHNDYESHPHKKGLPEGHAPLTREMVVPIMHQGQIVIVMGVGNKENDYTEFDLDILTQLANFVWEVYDRRLTETRFEGLFNTTDDGVMVVDGHTYICEVNDRYCEMSGYTREELAGKKIKDVEAIMSPEEVQENLKDFISTGSARFESCHLRKDGTLFDVDVSATMIQSEPLSIIAFLRDITDQKASERALRENQERFEALSDASFESIFFSEKGKCLDQNLTAERMFGYTREEAIGRMGTEWIIPEDRETVMNNMMSNYEEPYEVIALRKDGSTFPCEIQARTTTYQERTVRITALRDISPRRLAEQARRESEEKLRSVIEQSNDAIYIYWNGKIDLINKRFSEMTGVSADEAMANSFELLSMADTSDNSDLESKLHGPRSLDDEPENMEFVLIMPDGARTHVMASVKGIHYQDDEALLIVLRDVTLQKELEEQFRQSQKMESIGLLAGGIAHDFNNLLSPVIGNAELALLNLSHTDRHYQEFVDIYSAASKAKELVRQLLAFSRRQTLDFITLDINTLIMNLEKILRRTIREDIDVEFKFVDDTPYIRADASQIEQVLLNLCINAQDAMQAGGAININTEIVNLSEEETLGCPGLIAGKHVLLTIKDTGHGMDEETLKRVFDPFFTTKEVGRGTGLGLSTVHGIVEQHRGYITVDSKMGSGTRFTIYFPFSSDENEPLVEQPLGIPDQFEGKTALLVEDQEEVRKVVRRILTYLGLEVVSTGNPLKVIQRVEEGEITPDLLFTDVIMPKMNGRELYEKLSVRRPDLRVIFVSGYSQDVMSEKGVNTQEMISLQKPITMKSITDALNRVFSE